MTKPTAPAPEVTAEPDFWRWWTSEPHRLKYYADDPVCIAAREAWDAARAHQPVQPTEPVSDENWPPRFHFTAEGIAALFLKKHFGDSAGMPQVTELAEIIKSAVQNAHPPVQPTEPRPWVSLSESEIMRLWRDAGLPEYFLGNGGSNAHLCQFAALVIAESRCRNGFANPPVQPTEPK